MIQSFVSQAKKFIYAIFLASAVLCFSAPAVAQTNTAGTIRVESKEVLVPVVVLDKRRLEQLEHMNRSVFWHRFNTGDFNPLEGLTVRGLSANDFTVLQDGEEERIESFTPDEQKQSPILTNNVGKFREFVGVGGGTWAIPLWENLAGSSIVEASWSGYEIGYTPSSSPDGSCHKLQVTVNRVNSLVYLPEANTATLHVREPILSKGRHSGSESNQISKPISSVNCPWMWLQFLCSRMTIQRECASSWTTPRIR